MATAKLAARVRAVNRANEYAAKLYPLLVEALKPFAGEAVVKVNGDLTAKVEKALPAAAKVGGGGDGEVMVYRYRSNYSLAWVVKTCESVEGQGVCVYHEVVIYVADLKGQVMGELFRPWEDPGRHTVAEVDAKREAYRIAQRAADEARLALFPFGEYDN